MSSFASADSSRGSRGRTGITPRYFASRSATKTQPPLFDVDGPPSEDDDFGTIPLKSSSSSTVRSKSALQQTESSSNNNNNDDDGMNNDQQNAVPVVSTDDSIPHGIAGGTAIVKAADALECRQSVINFVINATDTKDECEGLKKAFDKTCNSESTRDVLQQQQQQQQRHHNRRLSLATKFAANGYSKSLQEVWYKTTRAVRLSATTVYRKFLLGPDDHDFYADYEVASEDGWAREDAKYQVKYGYDIELRQELNRELELEEARERELENTMNSNSNKNDGARQGAGSSNANQQAPPPPQQTTDKPAGNAAGSSTSLSLPLSTKQHVSDQMLSQTLILQQPHPVQDAIDSVVNATNNTLRGAAVEAATAAKAVEDTTAVVTAVLNDPTSVEARTCCASILNVFRENCDVPDQQEVSDRKLFLIVFVIAFCGVVKSIIRHYQIRWLPEAAGCILVGVACGAAISFVPHYDISFDGDWFLRIMVPPIVFEAALSIDKRSFNRHIIPIVIYAVVGTLLATFITAFVVHRGTLALSGYCETIPVVEALTFGALISSIDPIAVLSVLGNMGMTDTDTIYVLIFGESLLNDGVAIVLFQTLVHFLDEKYVIDAEAVWEAVIHFFVVAAGSLMVGVGSGFASTGYFYMMQGCQTPLVEVVLFFCWAFIPYYVCDGIEWSGIVAIVATGFVMDLYVVGQDTRGGNNHNGGGNANNVNNIMNGGDDSPMADHNNPMKPTRRNGDAVFSGHGHLSTVAKTHVGFVTEILSTVMETAIFAYLGVFLYSKRYHWNFWHAVLAILGCCVSRAVMIPLLSIGANFITRNQHVQKQCHSPHRRNSSLGSGTIHTTTGNNNTAGTSSTGIPLLSGVIVDKRMQLVLWVAGMRGAMSFALVENIPLYDEVTGEGSRLKAELKAMTSACIVFTVFCLGGYTYYLVDYLGMAPKRSSGNKEMVSLLAASSHDSMGSNTSITSSGGGGGVDGGVGTVENMPTRKVFGSTELEDGYRSTNEHSVRQRQTKSGL